MATGIQLIRSRSDQHYATSSERLQRSRSRVFYESDEITSPTSWEFRVFGSNSGSPKTSVTTNSVENTPNIGSTTPTNDSNGESKNSSGSSLSSSAESHRSHDSGFLDSKTKIKNRTRNIDDIANKNATTFTTTNVELNENDTTESTSFSEYRRQISHVSIIPSCANNKLNYEQTIQQSPKDISFRNNEEILTRSTYKTKSSFFHNTNSRTTPIVTLHNGLGQPSSSSTPKRPTFLSSRIDNFESLNKNIKIIDPKRSKNNFRKAIAKHCTQLPLPHPPPYSPPPALTNTKYSKCHSFPSITSSFCSQQGIIQPKNLPLRSSKSGSDILKNNTSLSYSAFNTQLSYLPKCLPLGFKRIPLVTRNSTNLSTSQINTKTSVFGEALDLPKEERIIKSHFDNDSMRQWLHDLRYETEPDSLYTLQIKAITKETLSMDHLSSPSKNNASISTPFILVRRLEKAASFISEEYAFICKSLEYSSYDVIPGLLETFIAYVESFLQDINDFYGKTFDSERALSNTCYRIRLAIVTLYGTNQLVTDLNRKLQVNRNSKESLEAMQLNLDNETISEGNKEKFVLTKSPEQRSTSIVHKKPNSTIGLSNQKEMEQFIWDEIFDCIISIGSLLTDIVDNRLRDELALILDYIKFGGVKRRIALQMFTSILFEGGIQICRLASTLPTVETLILAFLNSRKDIDRILALRCISTILIAGNAVNVFDQVGGFNIIGDVLWNPSASIPLKYEIVAVLVQATDPWIDLEYTLSSLGNCVEQIISSLTRLIQYGEMDDDSFLLIVAAISNLTFLELSSIELLRVHKTIPLIISFIRKNPNISIFVKDHISTIFANMSGINNCRYVLIQNQGIELLVHFLKESPSKLKYASRITACERLQQKAAIALSRLASESCVAEKVAQLGGLERLVEICRNDRERNYSDGVLIASLATLRKLTSTCKETVIKNLDAEELIQPRLLDSFLLFSSRQESYV